MPTRGNEAEWFGRSIDEKAQSSQDRWILKVGILLHQSATTSFVRPAFMRRSMPDVDDWHRYRACEHHALKMVGEASIEGAWCES